MDRQNLKHTKYVKYNNINWMLGIEAINFFYKTSSRFKYLHYARLEPKLSPHLVLQPIVALESHAADSLANSAFSTLRGVVSCFSSLDNIFDNLTASQPECERFETA